MEELIAQFERDIQFDTHSFAAKVRRSQAGKDIVAQGREALPLIVKRLESAKLDPKGEISCAWAALMAQICIVHTLDTAPGLSYGDISAWIAWAKSVINPVPA